MHIYKKVVPVMSCHVMSFCVGGRGEGEEGEERYDRIIR